MTIKQLLDFSALMDTFCQQAKDIAAQSAARKASARHAWQQQTDTLTAAATQVEHEYADTEDRRRGWADQYAAQADRWLDELEDPLWHAVKDNCFLRCISPRAELAGKSEIQLITYLQERQFQMEDVLQKLNSSFIPASMSGTVGKVIPGYKRKLHRRLAQSYTDICCAADALRSCGDIARGRAAAAEETARRQRQYDEALGREQALADAQTQQESTALQAQLAAALNELETLGLFRPNAPICPGIWFRSNPLPGSSLPHPMRQSADGALLSFPLYLPAVHCSCFLLTDSESDLTTVFTSCGLDILQAVPDSQVCFADSESLGSRYSPLAPLAEYRRVHIWSTETALRSGLESLSRRIAEYHTTGKAPAAPVFLFVSAPERSIPVQELPRFFSIAKNGPPAGVFVLFSMNRGVVPDRVLADQLRHLEKTLVLSVEKNILPLPNGAGIRLQPRPELSQRVQALAEREASLRRRSAVLPLANRLPADGAWQRKSAAGGIEITVGDAPDGVPVSLCINAEKPYVLIIGDVASGKSSLSHTICLQIMANYSPDEVRLAIADLKMGAEFNVYAEAALPSVEAVMNDEDPDVMVSFLQHYVAEMQRRQTLFDALESETGQMVRKYESYREVWASHSRLTESLPRLVVLIDEFQTLFEDSSVTARLLSELVRKGRTYGIHIVMASQRAVGDSVRNSFTAGLKNYFTSRFVLRVPQSAARTVLSERCADTGRENSGIAAAAALPRGHAVFNGYMGELEAENRRIQCCYPDDRTITAVCRSLSELNGKGTSVLLRQGAPSPAPVLPKADALLLGTSPCLHRDAGSAGGDVVLDDTYVSVSLAQQGQNLLLTGSDIRMVQSVTRSAALYLLNRHPDAALHVFGLPASPAVQALLEQHDPAYVFHTTEEEMQEELTRQAEEGPMLRVNLFVEPDTFPCRNQSCSDRTAPEAALLKQILSHADSSPTVNLVYGRTFRSLRSRMPYAVQASPVRLTAIGDAENLRATMPESCRMTPTAFDLPRANAISAYYCNADSGKWGKVLLFAL